MTISQKIQYFVKLPFEHKLWFVFSIFSSFIVWLSIRYLKAKRLHALMGNYSGNSMLCVIATKQQSLKAWRIARIVEAVCRGVPWECKCLNEAICTNCLLYFYRIPSVFYLGSMLDSNSQSMQAHAWLNVGEYCIIGGKVADDGYIVTATFTRPAVLINS